MLSTSLLGWEGIAEATAGLRLVPGGTLMDLAFSRGGYGLEIAVRAGARLVGVDFSAEAVRQAREQARRLGVAAEFCVGDLASIGLGTGSADAVLCPQARTCMRGVSCTRGWPSLEMVAATASPQKNGAGQVRGER